MTRQEAEEIVRETLQNLAESPQFSAPKRVFTAIEIFLAPDPAANGQAAEPVTA